MLPHRSSLASVTHLRAEYQAFEGGKLLATDSRLMPLEMPKLNIICGRKEVRHMLSRRFALLCRVDLASGSCDCVCVCVRARTRGKVTSGIIPA